MSEDEINLRISVLLSLQRALFGAITPKIRAISADWSLTNKTIVISVIFDGDFNENDEDSMRDVETYVMADFPWGYKVKLHCVRLDYPSPLSEALLGSLVYKRKEYP